MSESKLLLYLIDELFDKIHTYANVGFYVNILINHDSQGYKNTYNKSDRHFIDKMNYYRKHKCLDRLNTVPICQ